ncbi:fibrous sheath CABYR-binding protein-like [Cocos nucifera]|uniref:Fibrous sheath CABYR-binding protein-like n=1 Tax=Cocos nucifera TaxID=13894 RepID=A0A8K0IQT4_COCNU|nr:fibrous sheath CABYR-binding protein-like [Cocos nucifera]
MISYGGRIQPRPHDNQLSYIGGETKILTIDRSIRLPALLSKLASFSNIDDNLCFKYQLPGDDLDALISVTNDKDLDHTMLEYDRLHRFAARPTARLRVFLFSIKPPNPSAALLDPKPERQWFVDALNSVPVPPPLDTVAAAPPPPATAGNATSSSPDYLFGLDEGFVPPPAVKVKDPSLEQPPVLENFQGEVLVGKEDPRRIGGGETTPAEIQDLQRLQIAENQQQQQAAIQRNSGEEFPARVYPAEYYLPRVQEKDPPPVTTQVPAAAYWPEQSSVAVAGRSASVAGGDRPVYLIPSAPGVYPSAAAAGQGHYVAPVRRAVPVDVYRDAAAPNPVAVYAVRQPSAAAAAAATVVGQYAAEGTRVPAQGGVDSAGYKVAYDSAGRAVYYTGAVPMYQTVTSAALPPEVKAVRPSPAS